MLIDFLMIGEDPVSKDFDRLDSAVRIFESSNVDDARDAVGCGFVNLCPRHGQHRAVVVLFLGISRQRSLF